MKLSDRIYNDSDAAPWVIDEIVKLETEVERLRAALQKIAYLQHDIGRPPLISEAEAMRIKARDALHDSRAIERAHGIGG